MKTLSSKTGIKLLCATLAVALGVIFIGSVFLSVADVSATPEEWRLNVMHNLMHDDTERAYWDYYALYENSRNNSEEVYAEIISASALKTEEEYFTPENTNFRFGIYNSDGEMLFGTYDGGTFYTVYTISCVYSGSLGGETVDDSIGETRESVYARGYLPENRTVVDVYFRADRLVDMYGAWSGVWLPIAAISGAFCILLLVFLIYASGRREVRGEDGTITGIETRPHFSERIPWDLWLAIVAVLVVFSSLAVRSFPPFNYGYFVNNSSGVLLALGVIAALVLTCALLVLLSVSRRVRLRGWLKNSVIYFLLSAVFRGIVWVFRFIWRSLAKIPLIWKTVICCIVFIVSEIIAVVAALYGWVFLWLLINLVPVALVCAFAVMLRRLGDAGRRIAGGDTDYRVSTAGMPSDLREHGECLNRIGGGLSLAVEDKLRSERMKTELITNVSHDLKTPLTSIINYVELLKKLGIEGDAAEYISVLEKQSQRLKKLTGDLVEASKASSGALPITPERICVNELLSQAEAEYSEQLAAHRLEAVAVLPEEQLYATGDGKYVWRILDNLLGNAAKYALDGTRVYLTLISDESTVRVEVKNVSREKLNIRPDELMERFVRGDTSRNTEGSGLGLSIARSLAELMHGSLDIAIDGDLFKATLILPRVE